MTELEPFVVFLTGSVIVDAQIHCNLKNNTVFVSRNIVLKDFKYAVC